MMFGPMKLLALLFFLAEVVLPSTVDLMAAIGMAGVAAIFSLMFVYTVYLPCSCCQGSIPSWRAVRIKYLSQLKEFGDAPGTFLKTQSGPWIKSIFVGMMWCRLIRPSRVNVATKCVCLHVWVCFMKMCAWNWFFIRIVINAFLSRNLCSMTGWIHELNVAHKQKKRIAILDYPSLNSDNTDNILRVKPNSVLPIAEEDPNAEVKELGSDIKERGKGKLKEAGRSEIKEGLGGGSQAVASEAAAPAATSCAGLIMMIASIVWGCTVDWILDAVLVFLIFAQAVALAEEMIGGGGSNALADAAEKADALGSKAQKIEK